MWVWVCSGAVQVVLAVAVAGVLYPAKGGRPNITVKYR